MATKSIPNRGIPSPQMLSLLNTLEGKWKQIDNWIAMTAPDLDRHNDSIQIYVKETKNGYLLTDDGFTLTDLAQTGFPLDSLSCQKKLSRILKKFGVMRVGDALEITAKKDSFAKRYHDLLHAILALNTVTFINEPA